MEDFIFPLDAKAERAWLSLTSAHEKGAGRLLGQQSLCCLARERRAEPLCSHEVPILFSLINDDIRSHDGAWGGGKAYFGL